MSVTHEQSERRWDALPPCRDRYSTICTTDAPDSARVCTVLLKSCSWLTSAVGSYAHRDIAPTPGMAIHFLTMRRCLLLMGQRCTLVSGAPDQLA